MTSNGLDDTALLAKYRQKAATGRPYSWFNYQPINLPGFEETLPLAGRDCFDRLAAVKRQLRRCFGDRPLRIIDWGCNLGFFCFELAKLGHCVLGIDNNPELVSICRHLASSHSFPIRPRFVHASLSPESLRHHQGFDVALCLSVLHHLKETRGAVLEAFAATYSSALIEMDGAGFGYNTLFSFYWDVEEVGEACDRYGSGRRRRKILLCRNQAGSSRYRNVKKHNIVGGRGVFRKQTREGVTLLKRELLASRHTWIRTDLRHEVRMYRRLRAVRFFPRMLGTGANERFRWMELEYLESDAGGPFTEVVRFYDFLRRERLFLIDVSVDSFVFQQGGLKVVDLESLFPVESTIEDLIRSRTNRETIRLASYDAQLDYLRRRLT